MELKSMLKNFATNLVAASILCPRRIRILIYKACGHEVSDLSTINPRCFLGAGKGKLTIEEGVMINYSCWLDLGADIVIEENVFVAMGVTILNSTHKIGTSKKGQGIIILYQ